MVTYPFGIHSPVVTWVPRSHPSAQAAPQPPAAPAPAPPVAEAPAADSGMVPITTYPYGLHSPVVTWAPRAGAHRPPPTGDVGIYPYEEEPFPDLVGDGAGAPRVFHGATRRRAARQPSDSDEFFNPFRVEGPARTFRVEGPASVRPALRPAPRREEPKPPVVGHYRAKTGGAREAEFVPGFQAGGLVPALVSNGEYLMSGGAVARHGVGFMDALNAGRFAEGGSPFAQFGGAGALVFAASRAEPGYASQFSFGNMGLTQGLAPPLPSGIPPGGGAISQHTLDLITSGGSFPVSAASDTIEAIRSSAIGGRLTSTGTRPSWY
jgi:hypothetical protein